MKRFALALCPLALAACATLPAASASTGTPTAGFGQTANVGPLLVRPIALVEDSRCPINARCVWAGRLVIKVEVTYAGGSEQFVGKLTMGQPLGLDRGSLTLASTLPEKLAGSPSKPSDYRFTFTYLRDQ